MVKGDEQVSVPRRRFFRRRELWVPTWRGWLLIFCLALAISFLVLKSLDPFLSMNAPLPGGVLAVEGWLPDVSLRVAAAKIKSGEYDKIYVTGGPLDMGAPLSEFGTYAELGCATLRKFGLSANQVQPVPSGYVIQDRTYSSALALHKWFQEKNCAPEHLTVITHGPHARRSRLLFEKAIGEGVRIGVISARPDDYDSEHWWRSSSGFRVTTGEAIAYVYAKCFFHPAKPAPLRSSR